MSLPVDPAIAARATAAPALPLDVVWPAGLPLDAPCLWEAPPATPPPTPVARPEPFQPGERALIERLQAGLGLVFLGHLVARPAAGAAPAFLTSTLEGAGLGLGLLACGVLLLLHSGVRFALDQRSLGRLATRETLAGASSALVLALAGLVVAVHDATG